MLECVCVCVDQLSEPTDSRTGLRRLETTRQRQTHLCATLGKSVCVCIIV